MSNFQHFSIAEVIREARQKNFRTAKDFWCANEKELQVSYPHYASIETGKKLPDIRLAVAAAKLLEIDLRLICHLWAKDQMPSPELKAFFEPIPGREVLGLPATAQLNLDEFFIFTDRHLPFLKAQPHAWDAASLILSYSKSSPLTLQRLASVLGLEIGVVEEIVEWLRNEGIVVSEKGLLKTRRKYFHLPNIEEYREIRDRNFLTISADVVKKLSIEDLKQKEACRLVYMRRMNREQAQMISRNIDDLVGYLGNMEDVGEEFYALTIAFGPRANISVGEQ